MVRFGIMSLLKPQQKPSILYCIFWTLDSNVNCPGLNNFCFIFFTGKRLLTGGELLELWIESLEKGKNQDKQLVWKKSWQCETSTPVYHVQFSSDGTYFASLGKVMVGRAGYSNILVGLLKLLYVYTLRLIGPIFNGLPTKVQC